MAQYAAGGARVARPAPSSDRVRGTVFNWLMPRLPGARVLDLFAGS
ncbi:RsmD family RNA methyltransferase, partial [Xanthomonas fragariae]